MGLIDAYKQNLNERMEKANKEIKDSKLKKAEKEMEKGNLIYNVNDSIEELAKQNLQTMLDIKNHEAGSSWAKWGAILSMKAEAQVQAMLLKSIAEQQKILIRQNEVIIRLIYSHMGKKDDEPDELSEGIEDTPEEKKDDNPDETGKSVENIPEEESWYNKGVEFYELGQYDDALKAYKKALEINPGYADAWYNLACVYSLLDNKNQGLFNLKKAIEIDESIKEDAKRDEDFENLWFDDDFKKLTK
jgi:tetratricopeptide (TPR) repeat protein